MKRILDATLGRAVRHTMFLVARSYYALFYNVSCSNKHILQNNPAALLLSTHVSRHDGPLLAAILYSTTRVRPTVHYNEYHSKAQWLGMVTISAIPMSSPKEWPEEQRAAHKEGTLDIIRKVMRKGHSILLFPAGRIRQQEREVIKPTLSGVHEIMQSVPDTPILMVRIGGLGQFQPATYDSFWSFVGRKKGRRHVSVQIDPVTSLDKTLPLAAFNQQLEDLLNS